MPNNEKWDSENVALVCCCVAVVIVTVCIAVYKIAEVCMGR